MQVQLLACHVQSGPPCCSLKTTVSTACISCLTNIRTSREALMDKCKRLVLLARGVNAPLAEGCQTVRKPPHSLAVCCRAAA
jgi:hypothetical protein